MRFQVLGPLRIANGGDWALIQAGQQRTVLAILLAEAGHTVSAQRLINEIWGESPPPGALRTVQGYVFRLRRLMGGGRAGSLVTRDGGYELVVPHGGIDVHTFEGLVSAGRQHAYEGDLSAAAGAYSDALALWRGPALADVPPSPTVNAEVTRLELARLRVQEDRLDALLDLGEFSEVAIEARRMAEEHPLRERLWEQLMTALSRNGQRGEALAAFQQARRVLVAELGVEPGPRLQQLQRDILADRDAAAPAKRHHGPQSWVIPAQLPADVVAFTGRVTDLRQLDVLAATDGPIATTVVISTINGSAGIGKTALAVHWAHRHRARFPDGQLFVNLHGFAQQPPVPPLDALSRFLRALGIPPELVPLDLDEATTLYRSLLAGKRMLVVLDNARDAAQVRPLLPANPDCQVLVTSRDQLIGLIAQDGAVSHSLDVLTAADARLLLIRLLGAKRVAGEASAATELGVLCGHLPLALRVAAAYLVARPNTPLADYVARLREDRLGTLDVAGDPGLGVRVAFEQSYSALPHPAARMFRLLGLVPGNDTCVGAATALAGFDVHEARNSLDRLCLAHLVNEPTAGRFVLHDLLRQYAAEQVTSTEAPAQREAALARLDDFYLTHVDAAAELLYPQMLRLPREGEPVAHFSDDTAASAWLDAERANLVAAVQSAAASGRGRTAWRLADALRGYLYLRMSLVDWAAVATTALQVSQDGGDARAQVSARISLSAMHWAQGANHTAIEILSPALELTRAAEWSEGEATVLGNLGAAYGNMGRIAESTEYNNLSIEISRRVGFAGLTSRLTNMGIHYVAIGRPKESIQYFTEALELEHRIGTRSGEARTLANLGEAYYVMSEFDTAIDILTKALKLQREVGDRHTEADTIRVLATAYGDSGRIDEALELAGAALDLAAEVGENRIRAYALITRAGLRMQKHRRDRKTARTAIDDCRQALELARDISEELIIAEATARLAIAHLNAGNHTTAAKHAESALELATGEGYGLVEAEAWSTLAAIELSRGRPAVAIGHCERAIETNQAIGSRLGVAKAHLLAEQAAHSTGHFEAAPAHRAEARALLAQMGLDLENVL